MPTFYRMWNKKSLKVSVDFFALEISLFACGLRNVQVMSHVWSDLGLRPVARIASRIRLAFSKIR